MKRNSKSNMALLAIAAAAAAALGLTELARRIRKNASTIAENDEKTNRTVNRVAKILSKIESDN